MLYNTSACWDTCLHSQDHLSLPRPPLRLSPTPDVYDLVVYFHVYGCLACMHVYAPHVCLMPAEARKGHRIPWDWSYSQLQVAVWMLETKF